MTAQAGQSAASVGPADGSASAEGVSQELALLLYRAGIEVPEDRWNDVVDEYISFRPHLALVNQKTYRPEDEPGLVFVVWPASQAE